MENMEDGNVTVLEDGRVKREISLNVCAVVDNAYKHGVATVEALYYRDDPKGSFRISDNKVSFAYDETAKSLDASESNIYEFKDYNGCIRHRSLGTLQKYFRYELLHILGFESVKPCAKTGFYYDKEYMVYTGGKYYLFEIMVSTHWGYVERENCVMSTYTDADGYTYDFFPARLLENAIHCPVCGNYVHPNWYLEEEQMCKNCELHKYDDVIESYGSSHEHNNHPKFFGEYKGEFAGLGFELEVETSHDNRMYEGKVAYNLIPSCSFEPNELRYAHDGSLNNGFEIISEPHTVKDFWSKTDKWCEMLDYLKRNHYTSHNSGRCGLHIHVSRAMFGKTKEQQNKAIAKILAFYHDNFEELQTISRRTDLEYCGENYWEYSNPSGYKKNVPNKYRRWKTSVDEHTDGVYNHYCAINNSNKNTVEFRLGRGTINSLSFLAWIDLTLTLVKNSRRISYEKLDSNDRVSWLAGIKKETARYCLSRHNSFASAIYELYPELKWDTNNEAE